MRGMAVATRPAVRVQRSVRARGASASASVYTVQRNDNLWNIANKYGVSLDDLKRVNSSTLAPRFRAHEFRAPSGTILKYPHGPTPKCGVAVVKNVHGVNPSSIVPSFDSA